LCGVRRGKDMPVEWRTFKKNPQYRYEGLDSGIVAGIAKDMRVQVPARSRTIQRAGSSLSTLEK